MKASQLLALSALLASPVIAQDLHLFEQPDTPTTEAPGLATPPVLGPGGQPAYTLRSISRFGDKYEAVLVDRGGQTVRTRWNAGDNAPVQNSGFTIVAAGPGTLSLTHPPGDNCIAFEPAVSCSTGNRSELRLAPAAPLASNGAPPMPFGVPQGTAGFNGSNAPMGPQAFANDGVVGAYPPGFVPPNGAVQNGQQQVFINPFSGEPEVVPQISPEEAVARQQRQELRAARLRQFDQGAQIPDAAVPPNMERVRTPFGDRLIPRRE